MEAVGEIKFRFSLTLEHEICVEFKDKSKRNFAEED
jgi:hypothetical protein